MDEAIDVLDDSGQPAGIVKSKRDVHRDGDWHRSVHLWIATPDLRLLLQKRAATKESHPCLWDISAAGHIAAGESSIDAVLREVEEELGIRLDAGEVQLVAQTRIEWALNDGTFLENEFHDVYFAQRDVDAGALRLQAEEVDAVRLVTVSELRELTARRDPSLVPHWREYAIILEFLGR